MIEWAYLNFAINLVIFSKVFSAFAPVILDIYDFTFFIYFPSKKIIQFFEMSDECRNCLLISCSAFNILLVREKISDILKYSQAV